ncbi:MAG: ArnT family glycosyltransferase [Isosphaerales bacterium]
MQNLRSWARFRSDSSGLVMLFFLAWLPRCIGLIGFSNVDETGILKSAVRVLAGEIIPSGYIYTHFYVYANAAVLVPLYAIGRGIGVWHGTDDFRAQYFSDPTPFFFAVRLVSACLGALCAPLAASIANRLGLAQRLSLIVGGIVAVWPISVRFSHIAKPDIGSAFAILLLVWSILRKIDNPKSKWANVTVGVVLAIALSFKQTNLLVAAPVFVGLMAVSKWNDEQSWLEIVRGLLIASGVCVLLLIPVNLGLVLDLENFLHQQRFAGTTQWRQGTAYEIARVLVLMLAGNLTGITAAGVIAWLAGPFVRQDRRFLVLWGSSVIGLVGFAAVSGTRIAEYRLPPFEVLAVTLGCIAALSLCERKRFSRLVGLSLVIAIVACTLAGSFEVVRQSAAAPMASRVAKAIKTIVRPDRDKILAANGSIFGLPVSAAAEDEEWQRHERLAKKYGTKLPERAEEKRSRQGDTGGGYFVRSFPMVIGGMEDFDQKAQEKLILPFSWPLQDEEWELDYWTARGFNIFVVLSEEYFLNSTVRLYRSLHEQIKERCELVDRIPTARPLFFESEVTIYRFRDQHDEPRSSPEWPPPPQGRRSGLRGSASSL